MECRETQELLTAFHDGELPAAVRARVEEHLRGCRECGALLSDLARADQAAGVPDPGPAYWDRFNARVMDHVTREADGQGCPSAEAGRDAPGFEAPTGPKVALLRPKRGWMRQQLRYLVPTAAAAVLVMVVVRYGGMYPSTMDREVQVPGQAGTPRVLSPRPMDREVQVPGQAGTPRVVSPRPMKIEPPAPGPAVQRSAGAEPEFRMEKKGESPVVDQRTATTARDGQVPGQAGTPRVVSPRPMDREVQVPGQAGTPRILSPRPTKREETPPVRAAERAVVAVPSPPVAARAESASERVMAKDSSAEAPSAESLGKMRSKGGATTLAAGLSPSTPPCDRARALAERERFREAETAQRECLAQERSAPAQEKGLVFLAELLDRQARFAEADAVITEVGRQFPRSRPLDLYRRQRPMVQKHPVGVPVTR
ncbi:MAG: zf-HC2 domain-containing protein [bacterium]|jgi:hypothetical protein